MIILIPARVLSELSEYVLEVCCGITFNCIPFSSAQAYSSWHVGCCAKRAAWMERCSIWAKTVYAVYLLDLGYDRELRAKDATAGSG
eukprot:2042223-Pleurochrysis_carterae.AAC.1